MKPLLVILAAATVAGCMTVQMPLPQILEQPVVAQADVDAKRAEVAGCLYSAARSGKVVEGFGFIPMPDVEILELPEHTDVVMQFYSYSGTAALYRLTGATHIELFWKWDEEAAAAGFGARDALRLAPHRWLRTCASDSPPGSAH